MTSLESRSEFRAIAVKRLQRRVLVTFLAPIVVLLLEVAATNQMALPSRLASSKVLYLFLATPILYYFALPRLFRRKFRADREGVIPRDHVDMAGYYLGFRVLWLRIPSGEELAALPEAAADPEELVHLILLFNGREYRRWARGG